ncbi:MAG: hypothetical protein AAF957_02940 [Planctomycetota bacterium]
MSDETNTTDATEESAEASSGASTRRARRGRSDAGGEPPKRELEQAPLLLRKASVILMAGAVLPWMTSISTKGNMPFAMWLAGVVLTGLAGWVLFDAANARAGAKANGISKKLVEAHPMAAAGASLVLFIGAVACAFSAGAYFTPTGDFLGFAPPAGDEAFRNTYSIRAVLEHGTLYLALATFAHIHSYEYGAKFNPIFPLMFFGPAVAGALHVLTAVADLGEYGLALVGIVGSIVVAAGGIMAVYTMYVTMKVAKEEGDRKKAEARERKRAERSARSSSR